MKDWLLPPFATVFYDEEANIYVSKSKKYRIMSQGRTKNEALNALKDAVDSYLEVCKKRGVDPDECVACDWKKRYKL
ncbi:hypothetical protein LCGC14_2695340 [marine sediment metagenome]|uniref:HicB-like antitoxin of toxin-antitoxin system domain-containing protein n=1 Tax=marine sediment metagenome TaxID=412755 RepID=A0A0F8ZH97_9ZZZZ